MDNKTQRKKRQAKVKTFLEEDSQKESRKYV